MVKRRILCGILALCLVLGMTACGSGTATGTAPEQTEAKAEAPAGTAASPEVKPAGDGEAFHKFDKPVDVHIGMKVDPTDKTLGEGDSAGDTPYTRHLKETYNINIVVDWTAATGNDYKQKVNLSMASGNLPDGLVVPDRTYMVKAASAGLLYDITDTWAKYRSEQCNAILESTEGRAMKNASYNGRMVAIPNTSADPDGVTVMMINKSWLDKLSLPVPKTLAEIEKTAQAFKDAKLAGDKTIAISGPGKSDFPYCWFLDSSNRRSGFDPVFQALDAYPGYWLDDGNGNITYGTLSENTKKGLELLADWYKKGLIDREMGTRDNSGEPIQANQVGIFFGPWWSIGYGNLDSFKNDPTANWQAYPVYTDDGKFYTHMKDVGTEYLIISKKASEDVVRAIITMQNVYTRDESTLKGSVNITNWWPLRCVLAPADECEYSYDALLKILKGEASPEDYNKPGSPYKMLYQDCLDVANVIKNPANADNLNVGDFDMTDTGKFQRMYSLLVGDRPYSTIQVDKKVYSATYSQTETMGTKWANLKKMEDETVLKIIMGAAPISAFDKFVKDWKAQGGDEITKEVREASKQ
jgi:multiple sugar transport system substrate-binding protein/putative aldouronate transport system substrate-binding protein